MLGGDYGTGEFPFTSDQVAVEKAMLAGMQSISGQASRNISAEWNQDSIYSDQSDPTLRTTAGTLQGAYSFKGAVTLYTGNGYGPFDSDGRTHHAVMPTFLLEEPYDQEGPDGNKVNPSAIQPVRRFQPPKLWSLSFCSDGWQAHLNTQGARDMARLNAFIRSIA